VKQLDRLHPQLMGQRLGQQPIAPMVSFAARTEQLDLLSVVKASQTISGEIEIEKLVGTLLQVVLEQGGARKGYLILARDGSLSIEAEATLEEQGVVTRVLPSLPVESSTLLPVTVAHYARLTREPVILDDATAHTGKWATDAYFTRHRPRSVLCLPIVRQESLVGLLYLENSLAAGAFTPDRLTALALLAAQAAISMENALLHGEAQRAVRVRDEFLVVASHELRTPMTPITLSLRTLQDAQRSGQITLPAPLSQLVELAARQGVRLNRLIADLLAVSCVETGFLPLDLSEVELGAIVRDVAEGFAAELSGARCALSVRCDAPVVGRWDSSRIEHLVKTLLSNAIKFGAGKPIEILVTREGATARLAVRDHGIGIDPARQALVFGRLERGVSVQHYGGLGLGLYIGRRIVEAHRGSIRVESGAGVGSTFTVELPCAGPNEASARE
jgi:signal transduction histidine kinase